MKIHIPAHLAALALLAGTAGFAEEDIPLLQPEERAAVERQTDDFNAALEPSLAAAAKSTVRVWSGKSRLAYGTVVGDGTRVLTKWSQVAKARASLVIEGASNETRSAKIIGVYEDEDLALLEFAGRALPAVRWSRGELPLGSFVTMPQPDGRAAAFGVVSVAARNLRETDQAFLGIMSDFRHRGAGVKITSVEDGSGVAQAGLTEGDVIVEIDGREISGLLELRNALTGKRPGDSVRIRYQRDKADHTAEVRLGNRPNLPQFSGDRLEAMDRMGSRLSAVRDAFPSAVQTDMRPQPEQVGGPVVNLKGEVVGISLARAGRTRSYFMPSSTVESLLAKPCADPATARIGPPPAAMAKADSRPRRRMQAPRAQERPQERLRQHFEEMQQLMEFMRREMEQLEADR